MSSVKPLQSTLSLLNASDLSLDQRPAMLALSFARAIAYKLAIPAEPCTGSLSECFNTHYRATVVNEACAINETCVFDVDRAVDLTRQIWLLRYRMVHEPSNPAIATALDNLVDQAAPAIAPELVDVVGRPNNRALMTTLSTSLRASLAPVAVDVGAVAGEPGLEGIGDHARDVLKAIVKFIRELLTRIGESLGVLKKRTATVVHEVKTMAPHVGAVVDTVTKIEALATSRSPKEGSHLYSTLRSMRYHTHGIDHLAGVESALIHDPKLDASLTALFSNGPQLATGLLGLVKQIHAMGVKARESTYSTDAVDPASVVDAFHLPAVEAFEAHLENKSNGKNPLARMRTIAIRFQSEYRMKTGTGASTDLAQIGHTLSSLKCVDKMIGFVDALDHQGLDDAIKAAIKDLGETQLQGLSPSAAARMQEYLAILRDVSQARWMLVILADDITKSLGHLEKCLSWAAQYAQHTAKALVQDEADAEAKALQAKIDDLLGKIPH